MTLGADALLSMLPRTGSAVLAGRLFGGFTLAFPEYTLAPFSEMFGPFTANGKKALFLVATKSSCSGTTIDHCSLLSANCKSLERRLLYGAA
jgi:hypothetical protein